MLHPIGGESHLQYLYNTLNNLPNLLNLPDTQMPTDRRFHQGVQHGVSLPTAMLWFSTQCLTSSPPAKDKPPHML